MASTLVSGMLRGRTPAAELEVGDLITGDVLAMAGGEWGAYRVQRAARGGWVRAVRVHRSDARDLYGRPYPWREIGEPKALRVPREGVFVLPQIEGGHPDE